MIVMCFGTDCIHEISLIWTPAEDDSVLIEHWSWQRLVDFNLLLMYSSAVFLHNWEQLGSHISASASYWSDVLALVAELESSLDIGLYHTNF